MPGAKRCSMHSTAWRGNHRDTQSRSRRVGRGAKRRAHALKMVGTLSLCPPCDTEDVAVVSRLTHLGRRLAQTLSAQAILALHRHRQLGGLLRAPAIARHIAAELGAAAGTGKAARGRLRNRDFFRICHDLRRSFAVIFMSGSSVAAVYYAPRRDHGSGGMARRTNRWPAIRKPLSSR